jgi:uncharacterized membrane protein
MGICLGIFGALFLGLARLTIPMPLRVIFVLPLLLDGFSQAFGLRRSNNALRFVTGLLFSAGMLQFAV